MPDKQKPFKNTNQTQWALVTQFDSTQLQHIHITCIKYILGEKNIYEYACLVFQWTRILIILFNNIIMLAVGPLLHTTYGSTYSTCYKHVYLVQCTVYSVNSLLLFWHVTNSTFKPELINGSRLYCNLFSAAGHSSFNYITIDSTTWLDRYYSAIWMNEWMRKEKKKNLFEVDEIYDVEAHGFVNDGHLQWFSNQNKVFTICTITWTTIQSGDRAFGA